MAWSSVLLVALLFQAANPAKEGLKALDEERYGAAATAFQQVLEQQPDNFAAHFNLAFAYTMLGKKSEAVSEYKKTLELKPGLHQAELNLGVLLLEAKQYQEAIPHLRTAVGQKPEEFRPRYYLGEALYAVADDAGAEKQYRKAAAIDPKAADVEIGIGRAIFNQGRYEEAEPHYRKAAAIDPKYRRLLVELGSRYEEKGLSKKAISIYQGFADDPAVSERLGNLLLEAGRVKEALPYLQRAVQTSPTVANRFALATAYIKTDAKQKALPLLEQALAARPDDFELRMVHGRLLRDQRQFSPAAQDFLQAVRLRPDSSEAWRELASMLIMLENYPRALAALDKVESLGNAPSSIHFFRALIWDKAHQYKQALASYQKFLELNHNQFPNEEFKARQRIKVIKRELNHR